MRVPVSLVDVEDLSVRTADEDLNWAVPVDSTMVRAHQHAAGARKKGPRPANQPITPSAGPAAGSPRRSTWPATAGADRSPSPSRAATSTTAPGSPL